MTPAEKTILSASFGLIRSGLLSEGLLAPDGSTLPRRQMKGRGLDAEAAVYLYTWLLQKTASLSDFEFNNHILQYNATVEKLHDAYYIDEVAAGVSLLERWKDDFGDTVTQTLLSGKIKCVVLYVTAGIKKHHEDWHTVIKDSISSSDNAYRLLTGQPELTKEIREKRLERWRNASRSKQKELRDAS